MSTPTYKQILNDFKEYLRVKWAWLGLPPPTELQYELADFLQYGGDRRLIKGFRGLAKSWTTASYCEWCWLRNRDHRILIVGGNQRKADEILLFIRQCIDTFPVLEPLRWSDWEKQTVRWGIQQFNVRGAPPDIAPSCKASSIGSMLTGSRAHKIIGDDIETPNNSATVEARETLLAQLGEFESILLPGGDIALLGTPQSEESVYNEVETRGYNVRVWPVRVPTETEYPLYRGNLSQEIEDMYVKGLHGQPTEPRRFPEDILIQKEAGMARAAWRLQMMLDASLADADRYPLKLNDLLVSSLDTLQAPMTIVWSGLEKHRVTDVPASGFTGDYLVSPMFTGEDWRSYERKYLVIDPSGRGDNETTWAVMGTLAGKFFVLDFGGTTDGYSTETLDLLTQKAKSFEVNEVVYEDNFGDGMFGVVLGSHMKLMYPVGITGVKSRGQKERRIIETLEPVMRSHKLVVDHSALLRDQAVEDRGYSLGYQLTRITYDRGSLKWDDRLDCLAIGVQHCQSVAGVNNTEAILSADRAILEESIEDLLKASKTFSYKQGKMMDTRRYRPKVYFNKRGRS